MTSVGKPGPMQLATGRRFRRPMPVLFITVALAVAGVGPGRQASAAGVAPTVGSVIVNEYNAINATVGHDYFELLTTAEVDLRGLRISDNELVSGVLNQGETVLVFGQDAFLEKVPSGTLIVVWTSPGVPADTATDPTANDWTMVLSPGAGITSGTDGLGGAVVSGLQTAGDGLYVYLPGPDGTSAGTDNVYLDFVSWENDGGDAPSTMTDLNLSAEADAAYVVGGCDARANDTATNWVRHGSAPGKSPNTPGAPNPSQDLSNCRQTGASSAAQPAPAAQPTSRPLQRSQVVFNEFSADKGDFVELLVLEDGVDLRGARVTDNDLLPGQTADKFKGGEAVLVVGNDPFLAQVPKGTTVALAMKLASPLPVDQDSSDGTLLLLPGQGFSVSDDGLGGKVDAGWSAKGDALFLYSVIDQTSLRSAGPIQVIDYLPWGKPGTVKPSSPSVRAPSPAITTAYASNSAPCASGPGARSRSWSQRTRSPGAVNVGQDLSSCRGFESKGVDEIASTPPGFTLATQLTDWDLKGPFASRAPDMEGAITLPAEAHNNGMAVTAKGVIVGNYKKSDTTMQLHSWLPGEAKWQRVGFDFPDLVAGSNRFPSGMQAAGELIAFTDTKYVRFVERDPRGLGEYTGYRFEIPKTASNEVVGFTYDAKRDRFFLALAKDGGGIWATPQGEPYRTAEGGENSKFRFTKIASGGVGFGEAGIALVVDPYSGQLLVLAFGPTDVSNPATFFDFRWVLLDPRGDKGVVGDRLFIRGVQGASDITTFGPSFRWGATATMDGANQLRIWAMPRRQSGLEQLADRTSPVYWTVNRP